MTSSALTQGMGLLLLTWPHRADSPETVQALSLLYGSVLVDLTDAAWLDACRLAVRQCRHFPVPAELLEMADQAAEAALTERHRQAAQARLDDATTEARHLLTAGRVTEAQAAVNRERYAMMAAETVAAIRAGGEKAATKGADFWSSGQRRRGRRRLMPPIDGNRT